MTNLAFKISNIQNIEISLDDIKVGKRFREDLGNLDALATSISKDGMIHPIAVCKNSGERPYRLAAGGRRFAALKYLCKKNKIPNTISCRVIPGNIAELQLRVIEFAENMYRKSMTWQEECNIKAHIQTLQQQIHGVKTSTSPDAPGWSLTDLSKMTGKSKGSLSGDISMANLMKDTPEIDWTKFKTKNDAQKAIKHAKKTVKQSIDAEQAIISLGQGESKIKKLVDSYHIKDFFLGVSDIGDATMDFVEIDPPYGIHLELQKKDYSYSGYNEISVKDYPEFMQRTFRESFKVLKPNSWMVCWFGPEPWFEKIYQWIENAGFKTRRIPGIWVKGVLDDNGELSATGQTMQPDQILANGYEMFFLARKGLPTLNKPGASNVFGYKPIVGVQKVHPTERPIDMISDVLTTCAHSGSNVLVPFAGSGNTLIAAAQNNMIPVGFDLSKEYHESYIIKVHRLF